MKQRDVFLGLLLGLAFPLACFAAYAKYRFPDVPLTEILGHIRKLDIIATMLSLAVFPNLLLFFIFIWRNADKVSRGILGATLLYAFVVVILKFLG